VKTAEKLVEKGADVNSRYNAGATALIAAAEKGDYEPRATENISYMIIYIPEKTPGIHIKVRSAGPYL
jgi:ankyrin repeat protein